MPTTEEMTQEQFYAENQTWIDKIGRPRKYDQASILDEMPDMTENMANLFEVDDGDRWDVWVAVHGTDWMKQWAARQPVSKVIVVRIKPGPYTAERDLLDNLIMELRQSGDDVTDDPEAAKRQVSQIAAKLLWYRDFKDEADRSFKDFANETALAINALASTIASKGSY